jgi:hypothetical protein
MVSPRQDRPGERRCGRIAVSSLSRAVDHKEAAAVPRKKPADKEIETLVPRQTLRRQRAEPAQEITESERRRHEIAGRVALAYAEANPGSAFTRTLAEEIAASVTTARERVLFPLLALARPDPDE